LSNPSKFILTLTYRTFETVNTDGTLAFDAARAGIDYENTYEVFPGTLTFLPGETSKTITITTSNDGVDEYDERMALSIARAAFTPGNRLTIADATATGRIADDDLTPFVRIAPTSQTVIEGHAGRRGVTLTISLRDAVTNALTPSGRTVTVQWNTARGTALVFDSDTDFADAEYAFGLVTFAAGETSKTISVNVIGDTRTEPQDSSGLWEYFFVNLLRATNGQIDVDDSNLNHATVYIQDDEVPDAGPWYVQFSDANYRIDEDGGTAIVTLVRAADSSHPIGVYWTIEGTATAAPSLFADYTGIWENGTSGVRGLVRFEAGETIKTFEIPIVDDFWYEGDETIILHLLNPTGGPVRGAIDTAVVTIHDNEPVPVITISNSTDSVGPDLDPGVWEGPATNQMHFTIRVTGNTTLPISVNWAAFNDTAVATSDFFPAGGTVTFATGVSGTDTRTVTVDIIDDTVA